MGASPTQDTFQLTAHEVQTLRQTFTQLDLDNSGALTEEEFKGCLGGIGLDAQLSAILFNLFDKNKDGQVTLQEFLGKPLPCTCPLADPAFLQRRSP